MRSSPVGSDLDPDNALEEYIQWHISRTPKHADLLNDAKVKLMAEGVTMQTLNDMKQGSVTLWKELDIRLGIGMRLAEDVKVWTNVHKKKQHEQEQEQELQSELDFNY